MKKFIVLFTIISASIFSIEAGKTIEAADTLTAAGLFAEIPLDVLDMLSHSTRLDMLDYYAADSIYQAPNSMEGLSHLNKVTPDFLSVSITPVSTLELKILPAKNAQIALAAYTIGDDTQARDTDLRFYDSTFSELPRDKYIKIAGLDDFFNYRDKESKRLVEELIPFPTVRYQASPDGLGLTATLTVGQFMSADDYARIRPMMKPEVRYVWNGKKFVSDKGK